MTSKWSIQLLKYSKIKIKNTKTILYRLLRIYLTSPFDLETCINMVEIGLEMMESKTYPMVTKDDEL